MSQPSPNSDNDPTIGPLRVASALHDFVEKEVLPGTRVAAEAFWRGLSALIRDLLPTNQEL
ncbi:MAG: hypothetical protein ACRETD_03455, partial [Steroidobacteraceae bacterium]